MKSDTSFRFIPDCYFDFAKHPKVLYWDSERLQRSFLGRKTGRIAQRRIPSPAAVLNLGGRKYALLFEPNTADQFVLYAVVLDEVDT